MHINGKIGRFSPYLGWHGICFKENRTDNNLSEERYPMPFGSVFRIHRRGKTMSAEDALKLISDSKAKFVDYRFTDTHGKEQHVSVPASVIDGELFEEGKMFDGSSICLLYTSPSPRD